MKINEFCQEANRSPLFDKKKRGLQTEITPELLREINFIKTDYQIPIHLLELHHLINREREAKRKEEVKKKIIEAKKLTPKEEKIFQEIIEILHAKILFRFTNEEKLKKYKKASPKEKIKIFKEGEFEKVVKIPSQLPLTVILKLIPKFNQEVLKIRKKYKLIPEQLEEEDRKVFHKNRERIDYIMKNGGFYYLDELLFRGTHFLEYYKNPEEFKKKYRIPYFAPVRSSEADLLVPGNIEELSQTIKEIEDWEKKKFPNLYHEIHALRCKLKLSKEYFRSLKNYILYGTEGEKFYKDWHLWSSRKDIEIRTITSPSLYDTRLEDFEPYIEIKIYWDANVSKIKTLLKSIKEEQKKLPNYKMRTLIENTPGANLQRAIYYWLRKGARLSHKRANNLLEKLGYKKEVLSRDLKRFEELLGI